MKTPLKAGEEIWVCWEPDPKVRNRNWPSFPAGTAHPPGPSLHEQEEEESVEGSSHNQNQGQTNVNPLALVDDGWTPNYFYQPGGM